MAQRKRPAKAKAKRKTNTKAKTDPALAQNIEAVADEIKRLAKRAQVKARKAARKAAGNTGENTGKKPNAGAANIEPYKWKPGESGNLSGRPKKTPLTDAYKRVLNLPMPTGMRKTLAGMCGIPLPEGATIAEAIALNVAMVAAVTTKESARAAMEIANRVEGKVPIAIAGPTGKGPVEFTLTDDERRKRINELLAKAAV